MRPSTRIAVAVAATTSSSQWRWDARVLKSLPLHALGSSGPLPLVQRVPFGHEWQLGLILFGMPAQGPSRLLHRMAGSRVAAVCYGPPLSGGRRPLTHSPWREVVSRACHTEGAHPTASGRHEGVALIEQTALLWQLGSCLFGLPAREF